jgi:hypothetical protein
MSDAVNHPAHYTKHPSGVECITVTEHMNFNVGNAVKYLWRAGSKSLDPVEDLEKARWYVEREIARLKAAKLGIPVLPLGRERSGE